MHFCVCTSSNAIQVHHQLLQRQKTEAHHILYANKNLVSKFLSWFDSGCCYLNDLISRNSTFARWRHLTTTTRMHFAAIFVMQICVTHERFFTKEKNTEHNSFPQSILVVVGNRRHHTSGLLGNYPNLGNHLVLQGLNAGL